MRELAGPMVCARALGKRLGVVCCGLLLAAGGLAPRAEEAPKTVRVRIATEKGDILVDLKAAQAPATVANFLRYVDGPFYDGQDSQIIPFGTICARQSVSLSTKPARAAQKRCMRRKGPASCCVRTTASGSVR